MRTPIIFLVFFLIVNVQTFYIGDFRSAMHHVENGFEKLLTDVVNDMEDTIHCTISAVEHVLILNGLLDKSSDYKQKCLDDDQPTTPTLNVKDPEHKRQIELSVSDNLPPFSYATGDSYFDNIFSQGLHTSISNVNRTLNNVLDRTGRDDEIENIPEVLRDETSRLAEVSNLLRKELEKISSNLKTELEKINFDQKSPEASLWDEIQILHKVENEGNSSEVSEIHHVVDSALSVLKSNDDSNLKRSNNQIEKIIKELENNDSNESGKTLQNYKQSKELNVDEIKKGFHQISNEENKQVETEKEEKNTNNENKSPDYVSSFFSSFGTDSDEKDVLEDVINEIKDSQISSLLFKDQPAGSDVFGNTNLFNF